MVSLVFCLLLFTPFNLYFLTFFFGWFSTPFSLRFVCWVESTPSFCTFLLHLSYILYASFNLFTPQSRNAGSIHIFPLPRPPSCCHQHPPRISIPQYQFHRLRRRRLWCISKSYIQNSSRHHLTASQYPASRSTM